MRNVKLVIVTTLIVWLELGQITVASHVVGVYRDVLFAHTDSFQAVLFSCDGRYVSHYIISSRRLCIFFFLRFSGTYLVKCNGVRLLNQNIANRYLNKKLKV